MFDVFYQGTKPELFAHEQPAHSIEHAQQLSRTRFFWWVNHQCDYSNFDWLWEPVPWEAHQCHAWPSQHQVDSGTYLVPKAEYKDTNYHTAPVVPRKSTGTAIYEIDHLDGAAGQIPSSVKTVRYFDNYRDTLIRIAKNLQGQHEYVWICSSVCDYRDFDFSWHPDKWQNQLLHVFASDNEKFGDTFYMHVDSFADRAEQFALLDWYDINFVNKKVPRRPMPVLQHDFDSQADAAKALSWSGPLALLTNTDYVPGNLVTVPLWRTETKNIVPLSAGASSVVVPKSAVASIKTQLYDYPFIDKTQLMLRDEPLDIVFISNGEREANWLYTWLEGRIEGMEPNRLIRVDGVKGRVAAYQAAARASNTPWFFAVFGKLQIDFKFDWSWQPDRMQQAKHYIFHARNPVNDLVYGHQAMIAYNRKLVLENTGQGLDFTLDQPHEVVPILSGVAQYHSSGWMCWRTAFREALKLKASLPDVENEYRLEQWLTKDNTEEGWSIKGAQDAVEYYDNVNGNFDELRKSYEWDWLASYAFMKHGLSPNQ